jgi:competence protein ComEA
MWSSFTKSEKNILVSLLLLLAFGSFAAKVWDTGRPTRIFTAGDVESGTSNSVASLSPQDREPTLGDTVGVAPGGKVDLNTATPEVLETLPGIGPAKTRDIIAYRQQHGGFRTVEELDNVKGIGPATMARLQPLCTVSAANLVPQAGASAAPQSHPVVPPAPFAPQTPPSAPPQNGIVNVNTANAAQLETIKNIGPALAQRIIEYRAANGPFPSVESLLNVKGIGPKTLESMRPQVRLR